MVKRDISKLTKYELSQILCVPTDKIKIDEILSNKILKVGKYKAKDFIYNCFVSRTSNYYRILMDYYRNKSYDKNITHGDFWIDRIEKFYKGEILLKENKVTAKEFKNFINSDSSWGCGDPSLNQFFNNLTEALAVKAYDVVLKEDKLELRYYINSLSEDIYGINEYDEFIYKEGTLLNKLLNVKDDGCGKGEVLIAFLTNGRVSGFKNNYDILLPNGKKLEVKCSHNSFRLGTDGVATNFTFYNEILGARTIIKNLFNQFGDKLKEFISEELFNLAMYFITEGDFKTENALSSAIDKGELSKKRLTKITNFFYIANTETKDYWNEYKIIKDVHNCKYETTSGNDKDIINVFREIKYVRNPKAFRKDIEEELHNYFNSKDYLIVFDEKIKKTTVCTSADQLSIECISQFGLKVNLKSTDYQPLDYLQSRAYDEHINNPKMSFCEIYRELLCV